MPHLPTWFGPPEELPGVVPLEHFLVRRADLGVALPLVRGFSTGFLVEVEWCGTKNAHLERLFGDELDTDADIGSIFGGPPTASAPTFVVRLDDRTLAYDLTDTFDPEPPPETRTAPLTTRTARTGGGWDHGSVHGRATVWCQPLLAEGLVTLEMTWATADVEFASVVLDAARIFEAAQRASPIVATE